MNVTGMPLDQSQIAREIEGQKSTFAPGLLSRAEKDRLIRRAIHSLYRWYVDRSQSLRNWNPDRTFSWRNVGQNHSDELITIVEGFYAVEQYAPDYTAELARLTRNNYGQSNFEIFWGMEEEKHADLWRTFLLFSRRRTPEQIEQYSSDLRASAWTLPFDCPIRMLLYTVFQERATQLNYLNLAQIGLGKSKRQQFLHDADPLLADACKVIAADEVAHYEFFLAGARLYLYYYPDETLCALVDVLRNFIMPAADIVPNYAAFVKTAYDGGIFGRQMYAREVVPYALSHLGIDNIREVERGIKRSRQVPDKDGRVRDTALFKPQGACPTLNNGVRFTIVEDAVIRLFERIGRYEDETGISDISPTRFVANSWPEAMRTSEARQTL